MNKLFTVFIFFILCLACVLFLTTCAKEYSYEGGNTNGTSTGTAVYSLINSGGLCNGATANGKYFAGTKLATGNTIALQVNVTATGSYSLATNSINGIQFSASGAFTDTGYQSITLAGSGTPNAAGNFTFTPPVVKSCSFVIRVNEQPIVPASFTLAGAPNDCTSPAINGQYIYTKPMTSANTVTLSVNVTSTGPYTVKTDTIDGISFSDSGKFTTTGIQNVTLKGSGTATLPGNLTFTPMGASSACKFSISIRPPEPLAVYVLESDFPDTSCTNYSISGIYTFSATLSDANTVTVKAYVTYVGNFSIVTNVVDVIMFSYNGTFTTKGYNYVILKGTGTPVAPGTFRFTPQIAGPHPIGGEICSFDLVVR